jgi:hypothetical protein
MHANTSRWNEFNNTVADTTGKLAKIMNMTQQKK